MNDNQASVSIEKQDVSAVNTGARAKRTSLYAARQKVYPKSVSGHFRKLKWLILLVALGIYYITPWIRWDRGPYSPDQAVLIDMAHRRFYFFFIEIWPQEFYYVAGLLVMAGIGLFLVTSVVGRAWCGYACPQTVWTDLFIKVEALFEGDRNARMKLEAAPWTAHKVTVRTLKHATWLLIAVATGGAWVFYFADAPTLFKELVTGTAPSVAYFTILILTATTYLFGGIMREQVCIYMCPWPRIQGAMLDEDSLVVTYNNWRGEPRSHGAKKAAAMGQAVGDCVDCNACVAVCPTGIDIRNGQQLECITCALCIDACNNIMDKLDRERGLISYSTLRDYNHNMREAINPATGTIDPTRVRGKDGRLEHVIRQFDWKIFLRPRTLLYVTIWSAIGLAMLTVLTMRDRLEVNVLHDRNPVAVTLSDGSVRNGYTVKILNMLAQPRTFNLKIEDLPDATMAIEGLTPEADGSFNVPVDPDKLRQLKVYVTQPPAKGKEKVAEFEFVVQDAASNEKDKQHAKFEQPRR